MKFIINCIALACCLLAGGFAYGGNWQQMASYVGDCRARPADTVCAQYEDGYIWLIRGAVTGGEKRVEAGNTISVVIATTGRYQHILHTNYVCAFPTCDLINSPITTKESGPDGQTTFNNPTIAGGALDICREWGTNCGQPAADAYCQKNGYGKAVTFRSRKNNPPTTVINGGQVCQSNCSRITSVTCEAQRFD